MSRTINPSADAALLANEVVLVNLVEMLLTAPLRLATAARNIDFNGVTYVGVGDLGTIDPVDDSTGEPKPLRFNLSGVRTDLLAVALAEDIRGKTVTVRMAVLDPTTHAVLDAPIVWSGTLDQMPINPSKDQLVIGATAEHRGTTYARPKPLRYTDVDQQRLYPGDTSLRFIAAQANHPDVWPAASFFRT